MNLLPTIAEKKKNKLILGLHINSHPDIKQQCAPSFSSDETQVSQYQRHRNRLREIKRQSTLI